MLRGTYPSCDKIIHAILLKKERSHVAGSQYAEIRDVVYGNKFIAVLRVMRSDDACVISPRYFHTKNQAKINNTCINFCIFPVDPLTL